MIDSTCANPLAEVCGRGHVPVYSVLKLYGLYRRQSSFDLHRTR